MFIGFRRSISSPLNSPILFDPFPGNERSCPTIVHNRNQIQQEESEGLCLSDLPPDILSEIGKRIHSRLDLLKFRSVSQTLRSSLPAPNRFPLRVPPPPGPSIKHPTPFYFITEVTFYAVNHMIVIFEEDDHNNKFSSSAYIPRELFFKKTFIVPEFTQLSSRLSFLCNAYHLHTSVPVFRNKKTVKGKSRYSGNKNVLRIVIVSNPNSPDVNPIYARLCDLTAVAHLRDRKLALLRLTNNHWETGFSDSCFEDIVTYKGQLYAIDRSGRAFAMDYNSLQMTQVSASLPTYIPDEFLGNMNMKFLHLTVALGELYMFINESTRHKVTPKLYRLDLRIREWVEVGQDEDLGDEQEVVFVQNWHCNFPVARDLLPSQHEIPRFCAWPEYDFVRLAVGINNINAPPNRSRRCDHPWLG